VACLAALLGCLSVAGTAEASFSMTIQVGNHSAVDVSSYLSSAGANTYSVNGNGSYLLFNLSTGQVTGTGQSFGNGVLGIKLLLTDNAPGAATAQLFDSTVDIRNGGGGAPVNVSITATENAFTSPIGTVALAGNFSNNNGGDGNTNFQFTSSVLQGPSTLATVSGTGTSSPFTVSGQYTVQNRTTITNINANDDITTNGHSTVSGVAPEPATLTLALAGIPVGCFIAWRNRRKGRSCSCSRPPPVVAP
jgi:hypothetical protein